MRFRAEYPCCETRKYGRQRQIVGKRESLRVTKGKLGERIDKRREGRRKCARLAGDKRAKGVPRAMKGERGIRGDKVELSAELDEITELNG